MNSCAYEKRGGGIIFLIVSLGLLGFNLPFAHASEYRAPRDQTLNGTPTKHLENGLFSTGVDDPVRVFIPIVMCDAMSPPQIIEITDIFMGWCLNQKVTNTLRLAILDRGV
jgi:hypothetical protein